MASKFSLAQVIGEVSSLDINGRKEIKYIPLNLIDADPNNFYSTDGIEELADNILLFGLMDPILVRPTDGGRYVVISGHRRRLAFHHLVYIGKMTDTDTIPCIVDNGLKCLPQDDADPFKIAQLKDAANQLQLIFANSDTREKTSAEKGREVQEIRRLLQLLRDLGVVLPGKLRSHIAEAAHMSESRVARLDVIQNKLHGMQLMNAYQAGVISESVAYEIARRSPEVQARAEEQAGFVGHQTLDFVTAMLDAFERDIQEEKDVAAKMQQDLASVAPDQPSSAQAAVDDYIEKWQKENQNYLDMMGYLVDSFLSKFPSLLHSRREGIETFKERFGRCWESTGGMTVNYSASPKGLELRDRRHGCISRTWTEAFDALCLAALNQRAKKPEADQDPDSENEPDFTPHWKTGADPENSGWYALKIKVGQFDFVFRKVLYFDAAAGDWFVSEKDDKPALDNLDNILGWYPLPED